jgi:MtaA/CmuA family methyltransferase
MRTDPRLAAKVLADCARAFGYDCIIIDFDTCVLAEAMGAELVLPDDAPARVAAPAIRSLVEVRDLRIPDPDRDGRLPIWLETTREVRRLVGDDLAIMGRADQGPFSLLFAVRGHEALMIDVATADPDELHAALRVCMEAGVQFARAQIAAGADMTSIGDSAAGQSLISPEHYRTLAYPYQKRYKERLGDGLLSLHICGKTNEIVEEMTRTGSEILELDHYNDIAKSFDLVNNRSCIFGNIDPSAVLSLGSAQDVLDACEPVIKTAVAREARFVLCPGCLVNADVPDDNIRAMTEAAERWGRYD